MQIIYEDPNFLVINKPAGIIVHPKNLEDKQDSICNWVDKDYPELKDIGEPFIASGAPIPRHGIVHRLDKETSGLLIIAKNQESFSYFKSLFQERKIKKYYLALVYGKPKDPSGTISSPLGRVGLKRTTRIIGNKLIDSKEAETDYKTIKNLQDFTLLEIAPKTGRTHQIRVHLKSIGLPILGDLIYGSDNINKQSPSRLFLHAYKLEFTTPDGKFLTLESDLPLELRNIIEDLSRTK